MGAYSSKEEGHCKRGGLLSWKPDWSRRYVDRGRVNPSPETVRRGTRTCSNGVLFWLEQSGKQTFSQKIQKVMFALSRGPEGIVETHGEKRTSGRAAREALGRKSRGM